MDGWSAGGGRRSVRFGALSIALAALGAVAAPGAAATDWTQLRTLNIAHQGGENEAPSNTMYSYDRAMRLGSDMLEVDIHTSADGELIVIHDATVDRTTNGTGRVYDMTAAEIRALDAAQSFVPGEGIDRERPVEDYVFRGVRTGEKKPPPGFAAEDFRIPTLDEVIDAYPGVPINIEIKGAADSDVASYLRNAEALAAYLNALGRTEGVMVASFNDAALDRFHELAPQIDLAPATAAVAGYVLADQPPPEGTRAFQVPTEFNGVTVVDEQFVDRAHADGYGVHVWTINDEATMNSLLDWEADGIMTAEPMRLERVLCKRRIARPERPPTAAGGHCNPKASIACEVEAVRLADEGRRARVLLRRLDEFAGRCAGKLALKLEGVPRRSFARFNFGDLPPAEGGPATRSVNVRLRRKARAALEPGERVRAMVHPFVAFPERSKLTAR